MTIENRVSAGLSPEAIARIKDLAQQIRAELPFLRTLTAQDRVSLARLGDKTVGFDEKCRAYMQSNPEFLPAFIDAAEVDKDRALRPQLMQIEAVLQALFEGVTDTLTIVSSEILGADSAYYNVVRDAAKRGVPSAKPIYEDLAQRFPQRGRPASAPAPAATPAGTGG